MAERAKETPKHSPWCSATAGALASFGNAVLGSHGIEAIKHGLEAGSLGEYARPNGLPSISSVAKATVPGGLAFETHHHAAHELLHGAEGVNVVVRHGYHFVAGAAGGASFSIALSILEGFKWNPASWGRHIVGHGALFGSFDCYHEIFPRWIGKENEKTAVFLAGGSAGLTQHLVNDLYLMPKRGFALTPRIFYAFPSSAAAFLAYHYVRFLIV